MRTKKSPFEDLSHRLGVLGRDLGIQAVLDV